MKTFSIPFVNSILGFTHGFDPTPKIDPPQLSSTLTASVLGEVETSRYELAVQSSVIPLNSARESHLSIVGSNVWDALSLPSDSSLSRDRLPAFNKADTSELSFENVLATAAPQSVFEFHDRTKVFTVPTTNWHALMSSLRNASFLVDKVSDDSIVISEQPHHPRIIFIQAGADWTSHAPQGLPILHTRDFDRQGYQVSRNLEEQGLVTDHTDFGTILTNIEYAVAKKAEQGNLPVRILIIGAGQGRAEAELKVKFKDAISIEHISLNPTDIENAAAFNRQIISDFMKVDVPDGHYDRIISVYGSFHIDHSLQVDVFRKIVRGLAPEGEAFILIPKKLNDDSISNRIAHLLSPLRNALYKLGIELSGKTNILRSAIFIRKHLDHSESLYSDIDALLDNPPSDGEISYKLTPHGPRFFLDESQTETAEEILNGAFEEYIVKNGWKDFFSPAQREKHFKEVLSRVLNAGSSLENTCSVFYNEIKAYSIIGFLKSISRLRWSVENIHPDECEKILVKYLEKNSSLGEEVRQAFIKKVEEDPSFAKITGYVVTDKTVVSYETFLKSMGGETSQLLQLHPLIARDVALRGGIIETYEALLGQSE